MSNLVSVIVPCYNCEFSIERCLKSILNNTYKNIEVICINDGSSDNTLEILLRYKKRDSRLIVINQTNHRQGYARNRGLDIANGVFISFIDADDSIEFDFFESMVKIIGVYDIAICGYNDCFQNNTIQVNAVPNGPISINDFWKLNFDNPIWSVVPWNKLFRKETLKDIRFREDVYYEDEFFANDLFLSDHSIVVSNKCLYNYYQNSKSTMHTNDVYKKLFRAEARNYRSRLFVMNGWATFYNKTLRENLYMVLKIKEYAKKDGLLNQYNKQINDCLIDLRSIVNQSFEKRMKNVWDLYFYARHNVLFQILYFLRRAMRLLLRRNSKNA